MITSQTKVKGLVINGYEGDYIFETLKNEKTFYESRILEKWTPILQDSKIILDIGANLGNHSLYWALTFSPKAIYSFEPYTLNYNLLLKNIIDNGLLDVIHPIEVAVGETEGYVQAVVIDEKNLGATTFALKKEEGGGKAKLISIDSFLSQQECKLTVDLIKIDTEGFEISVLKGMLDTIKVSKPAIWVEVTHASHQEVKHILEGYGYFIYDIEQLNMLFLPREKFNDSSLITPNKIEDQYFYYLERTNTYYKNYLTAKEWLDKKNQSYQTAQEEKGRLITQNEALQAQNATDKASFEKDLEKLRDEYFSLQSRYVKVLEELHRVNQDMKAEVKSLTAIKASMQRIQGQYMQLKNENAELRRKLSKITDTWYGRIVLRCYKILKKVKYAIIKD